MNTAFAWPGPAVDDECAICEPGTCPVEPGWVVEDHAIGDCVACTEPCRSWDPAGRPRHLMCPGPDEVGA